MKPSPAANTAGPSRRRPAAFWASTRRLTSGSSSRAWPASSPWAAPSPHWRTLTLPTLHALAFPLHMAVADQMEVPTPGGLGGIATDPAAAARAERLGGAVAKQLGLPHDEVRFLGEPGTCPMCHLDLIVLRGGHAECGTCGAAGRFVVEDGDVRVDFSPAGTASSVHTLIELEEHYRELLNAASLEPDPKEIDKHAAAFRNNVPVLRPPRP